MPRDDVVVRARVQRERGNGERFQTFVSGENVDDLMTHDVIYGSRNIGRHDGGGFAPRVLETGKVHGDGTADESTVESARGDHVVIVVTLERDCRARKAIM